MFSSCLPQIGSVMGTIRAHPALHSRTITNMHTILHGAQTSTQDSLIGTRIPTDGKTKWQNWCTKINTANLNMRAPFVPVPDHSA